MIFEAQDFIRAHSRHSRANFFVIRPSPNIRAIRGFPSLASPSLPSFPSVGHFFLQKIAKTAKVPECRYPFGVRPAFGRLRLGEHSFELRAFELRHCFHPCNPSLPAVAGAIRGCLVETHSSPDSLGATLAPLPSMSLTRDLPIGSVGFPPTNAVHPPASQHGVFLPVAPFFPH